MSSQSRFSICPGVGSICDVKTCLTSGFYFKWPTLNIMILLILHHLSQNSLPHKRISLLIPLKRNKKYPKYASIKISPIEFGVKVYWKKSSHQWKEVPYGPIVSKNYRVTLQITLHFVLLGIKLRVITLHHLLNKSNLNTDKPKDVWIILNINWY